MAIRKEDKVVRGADLITVGEQIKAKLAKKQDTFDRPYDSESHEIYGCKTISPDLSLAEQIVDLKTIYEIRDNFDLDGNTLTIPDESVLRFNGGSMSNGEIYFGVGAQIEAEDLKIFDNITFTGDCTGQQFRIDWFVDKYSDELSDTAPDATRQIQSLLSSGAKNIYLTNKHHYRIMDTLVVDATVSIDGMDQSNQYRRNLHYIYGNFDKPLLSVHSSLITYGTSIKNIYLRRLIDAGSLTYENSYKKEIPTLLIDCTDYPIWGLHIKAVIYSAKISGYYKSGDGEDRSSTHVVGYSGIEISCDKYCYFVRIEGEIRNHYRGIYIHQSSSGLYTGGEYVFDSACVVGGQVLGHSIVGGFHEPIKGFGTNNGVGYYTVNGDCILKGYIWDTSYTTATDVSKIVSAQYSVRASNFPNGQGLQNDINTNSKNVYGITGNITLDQLGNVSLSSNLIPYAFYGQGLQGSIPGGVSDIVFRGFESDEDFDTYMDGDTSVGVDVTPETTTGYAYLFFPDKLYYDNVAGTAASQGYACKSYLTDIATKVLYFKCNTCFLRRASLVILQYTTSIESIEVRRQGVTYNTFSPSPYFSPIVVPLYWDSASAEVSVIIKYKEAVQNTDIPYIGICGPGAASLIGPWGGSAYGQVRLNSELYYGGDGGVKKYVTLPLFREFKSNSSGNYISILHYRCSSVTQVVETRLIANGLKYTIQTVGATCRISGDIIQGSFGFNVYRNSNGNIVIQAKNFTNLHIDTIEATSNSVTLYSDADTVDISSYTLLTPRYSNNMSGDSASRPTANAIGQQYFDATLGKPIFWNGSSWVDSTGTAV